MNLWSQKEKDLLEELCTQRKGLSEIWVEFTRQGYVRSRDSIAHQLRGRNLQNKIDIELGFLDKLRKLDKAIPKKKLGVAKKSSKKRSLVVQLSDIHMGQLIVTQAQDITYNTEICAQRIKMLADKVEGLLDSSFDELVILLGGDMIEGETIFSTQPFRVDSPVVDQATNAAVALWSNFAKFSDSVPMKFVTVRGNHGVNKTAFGSAETNWDNVVYQHLDLVNRVSDRDIEVSLTNADYNLFTVKGWTGMLRHGGPASQHTAAGKAMIGNWHYMHKFDFFCFGHLHTLKLGNWMGKPIFQNGSLCGDNEYSENLALADPPAQWIWAVSEDNLLEALYPTVMRS